MHFNTSGLKLFEIVELMNEGKRRRSGTKFGTLEVILEISLKVFFLTDRV